MTDHERARLAALETLVLDLAQALKKYSAKAAQPSLLEESAPVSVPSPSMTILRDELVERFRKVTGRSYVFDGAKDAAAVKRLHSLKETLRPELLDRWEQCLRTKQFPGTQSLAVFSTRVNSFGRSPPVTDAVGVTNGDPYAT